MVSLFWMAWTSSTSIHWAIPVASGFAFMMAMNLILMALFNYLTDSYGQCAASALATASCLRGIWGAILPLAVRPMIATLGVGYTITILGTLSALMVPVPFLFVIYGPQIRVRSPFCRVINHTTATGSAG